VKRYLVFAYYTYYPEGGTKDLVGSYDELGEALLAGHQSGKDSNEVLDTETGEVLDLETGKTVNVNY